MPVTQHLKHHLPNVSASGSSIFLLWNGFTKVKRKTKREKIKEERGEEIESDEINLKQNIVRQDKAKGGKRKLRVCVG